MDSPIDYPLALVLLVLIVGLTLVLIWRMDRW
jgi:hypothetical protein